MCDLCLSQVQISIGSLRCWVVGFLVGSLGDLPKSLETLCSQIVFVNMKEMFVSFECCSNLMKTELLLALLAQAIF